MEKREREREREKEGCCKDHDCRYVDYWRCDGSFDIHDGTGPGRRKMTCERNVTARLRRNNDHSQQQRPPYVFMDEPLSPFD